MSSTHTVEHGDALSLLQIMPDNSVDSIVTDPPYGLSFMGKKWDYDVPDTELWAECLRVLKPGGYLLAFAGTRTQHRMAVRIEDAGFEIRDMIAWVYGSGFPKSKNLNGERQGWGTALKPALEPITVARKPLIGTVAANVLAHGTGALNIDSCRVGTEGARNNGRKADSDIYGKFGPTEPVDYGKGRWPANLIHDGSEEVVAQFPESKGQLADASTHSEALKTQNPHGAMRRGRGDEPSANSVNEGKVGFKMKPGARRLDTGSPARFFYCAKASKTDRDAGNNHPTVKPTDLMRYLCRLVTPPEGTVLDPLPAPEAPAKPLCRKGFISSESSERKPT